MRWFWNFLDWIGRLQLIQAAANYVWTLLPVGTMVGAGAAGVIGHAPWMWIIFATSGAGSFITVAMFAGTLLGVWRDPQHKLKFVQSNIGIEFVKHTQQGRPKRIDKAQIMVQVRNDSYFPLSVILESANTALAENKPPRGIFPRMPASLGAGGMFYLMDDAIDMHKHTCGNLLGEADFVVRYGHPNREKHILHVKGIVSISMDAQGVVRGVWFNHVV